MLGGDIEVVLEELRSERRERDRERSRSDRDEAYQLRSIAGRVSKSRRVRDCLGSGVMCAGQGVLDVNGHVGFAEDGRAVAGFSGLSRCGALNICPWCRRKAGEERAKKVNDLVSPFLAAGGRAAFVVFTIAGRPHEPIAATKEAVVAVTAEFKKLMRRARIHERAGIIGSIEGWEFTVRLDATGHPHKNAIYLFTDPDGYDLFEQQVRRLWVRAAEMCGRRAHDEHGMRVQFPELDDNGTIRVLSDYVTKGPEHWGAGQELCRADRKVSRSEDSYSPFDLLRLIRDDGDISMHSPYVRAWRAYEEAASGTAVARFSRGLEERLLAIAAAGRLDGVAAPVIDDVEPGDDADTIAQEEALVETAPMECPVVVTFDQAAWSFIHRHRLATMILRVLEDVAEWHRDEGLTPGYVAAMRYLLGGEGAESFELAGVKEPATD